MRSFALTSFVACLFSLNVLHAQSVLNRLELGLSAQAISDYVDLNGSSNELMGSLNFSPALVIRYNMPYRFAIRATLSALSRELLQSTDNGEQLVVEDGYLSVLGEFQFNDYNIYSAKTALTPYLAIGLSANSGVADGPAADGVVVEDVTAKREIHPAALFSFGAKLKRSRFILSSELATGVRVATKQKSILNDWYVFPNFTITYTFGPNF
ncbi:MAG: hypothetical protein ACO3Q3_02440 [Flavobacteriaceae bacterium]